MDGVEVLRSNYYTYFGNVWAKFHHLRSTTLKDHNSAKEAINQAHAYALEQGTFDQDVYKRQHETMNKALADFVHAPLEYDLSEMMGEDEITDMALSLIHI